MNPCKTRAKEVSSSSTTANSSMFGRMTSALLSKLRPLHGVGLAGWLLRTIACLLVLGTSLVYGTGIALADPPTLVVYPTSLTQSSPQCFFDYSRTYTFHCAVSMGETINSSNPISWQSGSSLKGVGFNPPSGTLQPGQTIQVKITSIPCPPNMSTSGIFSFFGPNRVPSASVTWNCTLPPFLYTNPAKLDPSSLDPNGHPYCALDAPLSATYRCGITLFAYSNVSANWSASSSLSGVTFNPASGTLPPKGGVRVTIDRIPCQNGTFTFVGSEGELPANLPWSCTPPTLAASPSSLTEYSSKCSGNSGTYQCTVTLGESSKSRGLVNWSANSNLSGVTFNPASGTLKPGQTVPVTIAAIPCQNGTFTFAGSGGAQSVSVGWYCPVPPPTLTVSPGSLTPQNCSFSGSTYKCRVRLSETSSSQGTAHWTTSSDLSGVTFTPSSGTLQPGKAVLVTITAIPCQNGTFTFAGNEGETPVTVTWTCSAPTLTVSPGSLDRLNAKCKTSGSLSTCTVSLGESRNSNSNANWSASSDLSGVTFSPSTGTLSPGQRVTVTIYGIPCQNGTFTFAGNEGETPVSVTWNCSPPTLAVSPTSLDPTSTANCTLYRPFYGCTVSLSETSSSNSTAHWSASSSLSGVTFKPISGTLDPGKSILVTISSIPCKNGTFTFSGKEGETPVTVTWSCTPPTLTVSPTSLDPTSTANCTLYSPFYKCTVLLSESQGSQGNASWLARSPLRGVKFTPSRGTLQPGGSTSVIIDHIPCKNGTFTFSGKEGETPVTVTWSCTIQPPTLTVSPTSLNQQSSNCSASGSTYQCTVALGESQSSQGNANWSASSDLSGVIFNPASGTLSPGQTASVTISAILCQNGTFTFAGKEGETPVSVPWSCTAPPPTLTVTPTSLDPTITANCNLDAPMSATYTCTVLLGESSSSQGNANWSASSDLSGVAFTPSSGTLQPGGSTSVTIDSIPCQNGTFTFSGNEGETPVSVTWSCTPPTLTVSPTSLNQNSSSCTASGSTYQCTLSLGESSSSQGTVNWSASSDLSGVSFTPSSGTLQPSGSTSVTIAAIPCQNGTFTFSGSGGAQAVSVSWSCTLPPTLTVSPTTLDPTSTSYCVLDAPLSATYQCIVVLGETSSSQGNANWSTNSSLSGVTFTPSSGVLQPGGSASITIDQIPCQNGAFTFTGNEGEAPVSVAWSCTLPTLTVSPTVLNNGMCGGAENASQCTVTLGEPSTSQGSVNWGASSDLSGVSFNPSSGTLSPGQTATVTISAIPCQPGTFTFTGSGGASAVAVTWACANWGPYGYDSQNTRYNPLESILSVATVSGLVVNWQNNLNVVGSPVVVNNMVYINDISGYLDAVNTTTGTLVWRNYVPGSDHSPAVASGIVYDGADTTNGVGGLFAFDAVTGTQLWQAGGSSYTGTPTVANGIVYVGMYDVNHRSFNLNAFDASSGKQLWSTAGGSRYAPAVDNGVVFSASNISLYALDAATGAPKWTYTSAGTVGSAPTVGNGEVFVIGGNSLAALKETTGAVMWETGADTTSGDGVAYANGTVYAIMYNSSIDVEAFDAGTGAYKWDFPLDNVTNSNSAPIVANGVVYVGFVENSSVYALNASDGTQLWSYTASNSINSIPVVVNGALYIGTGDGNLYAFHVPGTSSKPRVKPTPRSRTRR